jgi:hypothetical protein
MDDINLLISGYLDDELTDDERERLAALLPEGAESLDRFAYASFIHYQLLDWMDRQWVYEGARSAVAAESAASSGSGGWRNAREEHCTSGEWPVAGAVPRDSTKSMRLRLWSMGVLAASLLIAASLSLLAYRIVSRPEIVGQLTDVTGSRWAGPPSDLTVGTLLQEGQELALVKGTALITFVSGAQLFVEAPATLRLDSAKEVRIESGRIAAKVPIPARGFTVTSSLARFVDLGTGFTLKLDAEKSFELHVFEGLVELQLDERFGDAAQRPLRVAEVRAVSFDVESGDVAPLHFEEGKLMPF